MRISNAAAIPALVTLALGATGCAPEPRPGSLLREVRVVDRESGEVRSGQPTPSAWRRHALCTRCTPRPTATPHSAHYLLALARRANGDLVGARASLERALEIHPDYVNAREELATLTGAAGEGEL